MCRNIKTLFNFEPPATEAEIHDAALQFVRKLSGFKRPRKSTRPHLSVLWKKFLQVPVISSLLL